MAEERPREALIAHGTQSLSLARLLAIVLRTGKPGVNAEELSRRLLNTFNDLRGIDAACITEICRIDGIGPAKASQIKAALELGKRLCRERAKKLGKITSPGRALSYVASFYGPYLRYASSERLCIILLNGRHAPIRAVELSRGTPGAVSADPEQIVREALKTAASSVILVHNHPSGNGDPSDEDIAFTRAVRDACGLFGIRLLDHVIVGRNPEDHRSLAREGMF
jgi:DNA repair protein RadC